MVTSRSSVARPSGVVVVVPVGPSPRTARCSTGASVGGQRVLQLEDADLVDALAAGLVDLDDQLADLGHVARGWPAR